MERKIDNRFPLPAWFYQMRRFLFLLFLMTSLSTGLRGVGLISLTGDIQNTGGTLSILGNIDYTITANGGIRTIVLEDWVSASDGTLSAVGVAGNLSYRINGGAIQTVAINSVADNLTFVNGAIAPEDTIIELTSFVPVSNGDVFSVEPDSFSTLGNSGFNLEATGFFSGSSFLANNVTFTQISNSVSVIPEPSFFGFSLGLGAFIVFVLKRYSIKRG